MELGFSTFFFLFRRSARVPFSSQSTLDNNFNLIRKYMCCLICMFRGRGFIDPGATNDPKNGGLEGPSCVRKYGG